MVCIVEHGVEQTFLLVFQMMNLLAEENRKEKGRYGQYKAAEAVEKLIRDTDDLAVGYKKTLQQRDKAVALLRTVIKDESTLDALRKEQAEIREAIEKSKTELQATIREKDLWMSDVNRAKIYWAEYKETETNAELAGQVAELKHELWKKGKALEAAESRYDTACHEWRMFKEEQQYKRSRLAAIIRKYQANHAEAETFWG